MLKVSENSPKLPMGYLSLAPLLWIPSLWRRVMDPVVLEYRKKWAEKNEEIEQAKKKRN